MESTPNFERRASLAAINDQGSLQGFFSNLTCQKPPCAREALCQSRFLKALKVGDGTAEGVAQGPLIKLAGVEKVERLLNDAIGKGARVAKHHTLDGTFFEPTVLLGVVPSMAISREEIFGPVAALYPFATEVDAIRLANDTEYGLAAHFYARDLGRVMRVAEALEYGIVGVNEGWSRWNTLLRLTTSRWGKAGQEAHILSVSGTDSLRSAEINFQREPILVSYELRSEGRRKPHNPLKHAFSLFPCRQSHTCEFQKNGDKHQISRADRISLDHENKGPVVVQLGIDRVVIEEVARVMEDERAPASLNSLKKMRRMAADDVDATIRRRAPVICNRPGRMKYHVGA